MSDIIGSTDVGDGVSIGYAVNPTTQSATIMLKFEEVTLAIVTLDSSNASVSMGGTHAKTVVMATVTANWSSNNITYNVTVTSPVGKTRTYTGTVVSW